MKDYNIDICYIVSHGFAARMILQTGLLVQLSQRGLKVGLVTPDKQDENLIKLCEEHQVKLFEYSFDSNIWSEDYRVKRRYVLEDIKSNPALWEKHLKAISLKSNKSKHPWRHIRPRLYYPLYLYARKRPSFRKKFRAKESKVLSNEAVDQFLKETINPKILVSTYPVNLQEAILLNAANKSPDIKTVMHLLSWDNITSKGYFPALADEYIAWGDIMQKEFIEYYNISKEKIHICGVPHFDEHIAAKQAPDTSYVHKLGLEKTKPYLFFAMSSPYFAPREIDIVEWLADKIKKDVFGEDMQLIVRPHPQNVEGHMANKSWLPRLKALESEKVAVDYPQLTKSKLKWSMQKEDMKKLSQLISNCTISFNSGSTVSIDALMVDKPVILTSFDGDEDLHYWDSARRLIDFVHLKKLVELGGVSVVRSYQEMRQEIWAYLEDVDRKMKERIKTKFAEVGLADGSSTEQVVKILINQLNDFDTI